MAKEQIIEILKEQYDRDTRKQLVKSLIKNEKNNDKEAIESSYRIVNQIFSYVISELGWTFSDNTTNWDDTPLQIMLEVFPKIDSTKWFDEQLLTVRKTVSLQGEF